MIRRKSASPNKQASSQKKEGPQNLLVWGQLGEIGGNVRRWRLLIGSRNMAAVELIAAFLQAA